MATQRKTETDSCIMCDHVNCEICCMNEKLVNGFAPNKQTAAMYRDNIIDDEYLRQTHLATLMERCQADD